MEIKTDKNKSRAIYAILALSFIGFLDALYLTTNKLFGTAVKCYVFEGCQTVNNSSYASVFGIPLSFFGTIFYLAIFLLAIRMLEVKTSAYFKAIFYLSFLGVLSAIYLTSLQVFVIKALCIYCVVSAADITMIFILALINRK